MTDQRVITWWQFQRQLTASARMMNQIEKQLLAEGWQYNHLTETWEKEQGHDDTRRRQGDPQGSRTDH